MFKFFAGLGVLGILLGICLGILCVVAWIQGIIMAFSASIILGIICLFIEVPFPIFAVVYWITGTDLAQSIVHALPQIFGS